MNEQQYQEELANKNLIIKKLENQVRELADELNQRSYNHGLTDEELDAELEKMYQEMGGE